MSVSGDVQEEANELAEKALAALNSLYDLGEQIPASIATLAAGVLKRAAEVVETTTGKLTD